MTASLSPTLTDFGMSWDDIIDKEWEARPFGPCWQAKHLSRAPERVRRNLELAKKFPHLINGRQGFASMDVADFPVVAFTAVTANNTDTNLFSTGIYTTIPAADMRAGKVYKASFGGVYTSTGTQGALTWTPRIGTSATPASNVTMGPSGAIVPTASITAGPWFGEFTFGITSLVSLALTAIAGNGNGFVTTGVPSGATAGIIYPWGGTLATTISNAAATFFFPSLLISVASQSYTPNWAVIRSYN
jgi:hypothetical protein